MSGRLTYPALKAIFGAVQQCRSATVQKMKTLFKSAKNLNKFQYIECGNQKMKRQSFTILKDTLRF